MQFILPMLPNELVNMRANLKNKIDARRDKARFPLQRELRYKLLQDTKAVASGTGTTVNISSGGVAFIADQDVRVGGYVELSISWPVLLDDSCPVRLVCYGRVLRCAKGHCACTIDKYEFRTQARVVQPISATRNDSFFQRWAVAMRKETIKSSMAARA